MKPPGFVAEQIKPDGCPCPNPACNEPWRLCRHAREHWDCDGCRYEAGTLRARLEDLQWLLSPVGRPPNEAELAAVRERLAELVIELGTLEGEVRT